MITGLNFISPGAETSPGLVTFEVDIASDDFSVGIEDSFILEINGIVIDDLEVLGGAGSWTVQTTQFMYGPQSVKVKVTATDDDETKSEVLVTSVSSERTISTPLPTRKAFFLDSLVRYFPEYTKARSNKYSVYRQFINVLGLELDKVKEALHQQTRALDLTRTFSEDPDWLYQCQLGVGESFKKVTTAMGTEEFEAPIIYGQKGVNRLLLEGSSSFLDFWTRALPNRFLCSGQDIKNIQLTNSIPISEVANQEGFEVPVPGHLHIWIHSVTSALQTEPEVTSGKLQIRGQGLGGINQSEDIVIIRNSYQPTRKIWKTVESLTASGPSENFYAEIVVYNFPPHNPKQDEPIFRLGGSEPLRWKLETSEIGNYLDLMVSGPGYLNDIVSGEEQQFIIQRQWLLDTHSEHVSIDSFSVNPTNYLLYGINEDSLYIWDRREPVASNLIELNGSVETPEIDFFVEDNQLFSIVEGAPVSVVRIELDTPRGNRTISSWGWSLVDPAGDRTYRDLSGQFSLTAPFYLFNTRPIERYGISQSNFTASLSGTGTWIFELTVNFMDGESEVVRHPFEVIGQVAIAEYRIEHLIDGDDLNVITCQEDGQLIVSNSGVIYTLTPMYDSFMIDFSTETISFRENFDSVELRND